MPNSNLLLHLAFLWLLVQAGPPWVPAYSWDCGFHQPSTECPLHVQRGWARWHLPVQQNKSTAKAMGEEQSAQQGVLKPGTEEKAPGRAKGRSQRPRIGVHVGYSKT